MFVNRNEVTIMAHKRSNKRFSVKGRGEYLSKSDFISKYFLDPDACRKFFFDMKWPTGYYCEKCGYTHYYYMKSRNRYRCAHCKHDERLLSNTIFRDNKLPLNVLLYGIFLIFSSKRGISDMELAEELKVNYKTACLLQTKCRILMKDSNSKTTLDSSFYESDVAYIGAPSHNGKRGLGTDKQAFLIVLSTEQENQYPKYIKLKEIKTDNSNVIENFFKSYVYMSKDRKLNTDGKTTFNILKKNMNVQNEKIDYSQSNHRLYYLNKVISNFSSEMLHVFHGIGKRMLPLYISEYEWRFNHRKCTNVMKEIKYCIQSSTIATKHMIKDAINIYTEKRSLQLA